MRNIIRNNLNKIYVSIIFLNLSLGLFSYLIIPTNYTYVFDYKFNDKLFSSLNFLENYNNRNSLILLDTKPGSGYDSAKIFYASMNDYKREFFGNKSKRGFEDIISNIRISDTKIKFNSKFNDTIVNPKIKQFYKELNSYVKVKLNEFFDFNISVQKELFLKIQNREIEELKIIYNNLKNSTKQNFNSSDEIKNKFKLLEYEIYFYENKSRYGYNFNLPPIFLDKEIIIQIIENLENDKTYRFHKRENLLSTMKDTINNLDVFELKDYKKINKKPNLNTTILISLLIAMAINFIIFIYEFKYYRKLILRLFNKSSTKKS